VATLVMKTEIFHLDSLQNKHILKNVMVPSVRMLYADGIIQFQQDHSSIHGCRLVQEWLSLQADIELIDWPPREPDMNPTDMWSEVKRAMQEIWPVLPTRNTDELWSLVSDAWDEAASSQRYVRLVIEPMTRRMKSVVEAPGLQTSY